MIGGESKPEQESVGRVLVQALPELSNPEQLPCAHEDTEPAVIRWLPGLEESLGTSVDQNKKIIKRRKEKKKRTAKCRTSSKSKKKKKNARTLKPCATLKKLGSTAHRRSLQLVASAAACHA